MTFNKAKLAAHRTSRPQKARTTKGRKTTTGEANSYSRKEVRNLMQRLVRTSHFRLNCTVDDLVKPAPGGAVHWFRAIFVRSCHRKAAFTRACSPSNIENLRLILRSRWDSPALLALHDSTLSFSLALCVARALRPPEGPIRESLQRGGCHTDSISSCGYHSLEPMESN
jgi:hypothetical protein